MQPLNLYLKIMWNVKKFQPGFGVLEQIGKAKLEVNCRLEVEGQGESSGAFVRGPLCLEVAFFGGSGCSSSLSLELHTVGFLRLEKDEQCTLVVVNKCQHDPWHPKFPQNVHFLITSNIKNLFQIFCWEGYCIRQLCAQTDNPEAVPFSTVNDV